MAIGRERIRLAWNRWMDATPLVNLEWILTKKDLLECDFYEKNHSFGNERGKSFREKAKWRLYCHHQTISDEQLELEFNLAGSNVRQYDGLSSFTDSMRGQGPASKAPAHVNPFSAYSPFSPGYVPSSEAYVPPSYPFQSEYLPPQQGMGWTRTFTRTVPVSEQYGTAPAPQQGTGSPGPFRRTVHVPAQPQQPQYYYFDDNIVQPQIIHEKVPTQDKAAEKKQNKPAEKQQNKAAEKEQTKPTANTKGKSKAKTQTQSNNAEDKEKTVARETLTALLAQLTEDDSKEVTRFLSEFFSFTIDERHEKAQKLLAMLHLKYLDKVDVMELGDNKEAKDLRKALVEKVVYYMDSLSTFVKKI